MNKAFWLCLACSAGVYAVACSSSNGTNGTQGTSSGGGGHTTTTMSTSSSSSGTTSSGTTSSTTTTTSGTGGTTTTTTTSTSTTSTSTTSTSTTSTSTTTTTTSSCSGVLLTVKNYALWCSISVNGTPITPNQASTDVCVTASSTVSLVASPASSSFELGPDPWHGTSGDVDAGGDPGTVIDGGRDSGGNGADMATITVGAGGTACVWACCPFTGGTNCPTTNQCP